MNQADLEMRILTAAGHAENALADYEQAVESHAAADRDYRVRWARVYTETDGPAHLRSAKADLAAADQHYALILAEGTEKAALELTRTKRMILSAFQTLANLSREEAALARTAPETTP